MANKQYWRRRRALDRLPERFLVHPWEEASLRSRVDNYERGLLRAVNGKGAKRHPSSAKSRTA